MKRRQFITLLGGGGGVAARGAGAAAGDRGTFVACGLPDIGRQPRRVDLQDDGREPSPLG
jgi:hypothetical protein